MTIFTIAFLFVRRDGVVDDGPDAVLSQIIVQGIPLPILNQDREEMIYVLRVFESVR